MIVISGIMFNWILKVHITYLRQPEKIWKDRIYGAPDFVVEVLSPSIKKRDTNIKLIKYRDAGVREYWIVDTDKERTICYFFEEDGLMPDVYTFDSEVPVRIYSGELKIRLGE